LTLEKRASASFLMVMPVFWGISRISARSFPTSSGSISTAPTILILFFSSRARATPCPITPHPYMMALIVFIKKY
jgi:hypothetical protein